MTAVQPHPVPARPARLRARRGRLLVGCALGAALAWTGHSEKAQAQAFQLNDANPTVAAGNVDLSRFGPPTPGTETITVNSSTAIINWNRAEANFLPEGNVATFQNGIGQTDFVVLNRVSSLDGGAITFNGSVLSRVDGNPGGTVLFQSSGGIILGPTAFFDVGNLVLTASTINDETGYGDIVNDGGGFDFNGVPPPYDQAIEIQPGARIVANAEGSYVVLAAPRVIQGGSVRVNGSAAYVGAETWSFTINDGLFDIVINGGSDGNANPIVHTGTTGGPASTGAADPHRIYMVTQPYSGTPVTMLLSGNIGFDEATSATIENGQIVLSAGFNVEDGQVGEEAKYSESNILITGGTFTSDVFGRATGSAVAASYDGVPLSFSGDLTFEAFSSARLVAYDGAVTVGGDVSLTAFGALEFGYGGTPINIGGGFASIAAGNDQSLRIFGNATVNASAAGGTQEDGYGAIVAVGSGTGGNTYVEAYNGADIVIDGDLTMRATGTGGGAALPPTATGGDGFGGYADLSARFGGVVTVGGGLIVDVSGTGTNGTNQAGQGFGGLVRIESFSEGAVAIAGASDIAARGTGGDLIGSTDIEFSGGDGFGGRVDLQAKYGSSLSLGTTTGIDVTARGGAGPNGGNAEPYTIFGDQARSVLVTSIEDSEVDLGGALDILADGIGGEGLLYDGGDGTGGLVDLSFVFESGGFPSLVGGNTNVTISTDGFGGVGAQAGGDGFGGTVNALARPDGGIIALGNLTATAQGIGGDGPIAGAGAGGLLLAGTEFGYGGGGSTGFVGGIGTADAGDPAEATFGNIVLDASGIGGNGLSGGDGEGGDAVLQAPTGQVFFGGDSSFTAIGTGGNGTDGAGGDGFGGFAGINVAADTIVEGSAGAAIIDASGVGGIGFTGGDGQAGSVEINLQGGELTFAGTVSARANGTGGAGLVGNGGIGAGRSAQLFVAGGIFGAGGISLAANGTGGAGGTGNGDGGAGTGGSAIAIFTPPSGSNAAPTVTLGGLGLAANGTGGAAPSGTGGIGSGGSAIAFTQETGYGAVGGSIALGNLVFSADAVGGSGAIGGAGGAGFVGISAGPISIGFANLAFSADGVGGNSSAGDGAVGQGGTVEVRTQGAGALTQTAGSTASLSADGTGGNGAGTGAGGQGLGGDIRLLAQVGLGNLTLGEITASAVGTGGAGGTLGDGGIGAGGSISTGVEETGYGPTGPSGTIIQFGGLDASVRGVGGAGGAGDGFLNAPAGGAGNGGNIFLNATGATLRFVGAAPAVTLDANGVGGDAPGGVAGDGRGGLAFVSAGTDGRLESSGGTLAITATGQGGTGLQGGAGQGGLILAGALISTGAGGVVDLDGDITLDASGIGGDGDGIFGGSAGTGGSATLSASQGGQLSFVNATVTADGRGGTGVTGGVGRGGTGFDPQTAVESGAFIYASGGTITGASATVSAQGVGGDGIASDGGDGFGGSARILATQGPASVTLGTANLDISAAGGTGATSYSGGAATAGTIGEILADGAGATIDIDAINAVANATGGTAGAAVDSLIGNGGLATAGVLRIGTEGGTATLGAVGAEASAIGGNGVAAGSDGGDGIGGTIDLVARGGTLSAGLVTFVANGTGGNGGTGGAGGIGEGGALSALLAPPSGSGAAPAVTTAGLDFTANGVGGDAGTGGDGTGGTIFVGTNEVGYGATGGSASLGALTFTANGNGGNGGAGGDGAGGAITLQASATPVQFTAATLLADGTGGGTFTPATSPGFGSGGVLSILALGGGGALTGTSLVGSAGGFGPSPQGNGAGRWEVTVSGTTMSIGTVQLDAPVFGTSVGGQTSIISLFDGTFDAGEGSFFATGGILVSANGAGSLTGNGLLFRGTSLDVTHEGRPAGGFTIDADTVFTAQVGNDFFAGEGSAIRAGGQVNIEPDGTAIIAGLVTGGDIAIRSADIEITDTGFVGGPETDLLLFDVIPAFGQTAPNQVLIGGEDDGETSGYILDAAEIGRIRGRELDIFVPPTGTDANRPPDAIIRDLTLRPGAGANAGLNIFQVTLGAGEGGGAGILSVEGALRFENAGAEDGIVLIAPGRVQVVNPTGSIRVLGANGLPGGTLGIESANIWSASEGIIEDLLENPNYDGRNAALLAVEGEPQPRGYIEAGEILLRVGDTLFVQNSGSATEFAGITVVQNTLTIQPTTGEPIEVYAFGRRINPDGSFVTNSPYFREVEFGYGSTGYTRTAQFNQCFIASGICPDDPVPEPEPELEFPIGNEIIEGPVEETEDSVPPPNPDRQEFVDVSFASESLLEEPVTSGGDSGVWDEREDCPEGETCEPTNGGGN